MSQPTTSERAPAARRPWLSWLRIAALPAVLAAGAAVFVWVVHGHYPLQKWLFWRYAGYWLLSIAWAASCVAAGHAIVKRAIARTFPLFEHLALCFAAGVYVFFLGMFFAGLLGIYGTALFVALPLAMLAAGALPAWRTARRIARHVRFHRARAAPLPWWSFPVAVFGLLGLGMVYFSILTPGNVAFDSRWYHLGLAEHYAASGEARRFPEGYFLGAAPHLASFVYTWAFLLPKGALFDRVELAAHLELVSFLFTLVGIPALVRLMLPRAGLSPGARPGAGRPRALLGLTWVVRFLFPGVFLYDSSLSVGADHMVALFAVPLFTLVVRAYRDLPPRLCALLAMMLAGVFLTKYTGSITLFAFPVLAVVFRAIWLLARRLRKTPDTPPGAWYRGPFAALGAGFIFISPHLIKNWAYYGDPLYPFFHRKLSLRPWTPDSSYRFHWGYLEEQFWQPETSWAGLRQSLEVLFTFSFKPHDWPKFHGQVPVFGSLFTLLFFCLPFLKGTRRVWALFGATYLGIFLWYWVHHQDRYLQTLLPWMASATASVLVLAWRTHVATRVALAGVLALQIVWGGDVWFIPGHAMIKSPIKSVVDLISSGYRKDFASRDAYFAPFADVSKNLPKGAKVLIHEYHPHLGISAPTVNDFSVNQGGISYGLLRSPREVYDLLKGFGVTHMLWVTASTKGFETLAGDLRFLDFAIRYGQGAKAYGSFTLAAMPSTPPPADAPGSTFGAPGRLTAPSAPNPDVVLTATCAGGPLTGLYHLHALNTPVFGPKKGKYPQPFRRADKGDVASLVPEASFLVLEPSCHAGVTTTGFQLAAKRKKYELWIRTAR